MNKSPHAVMLIDDQPALVEAVRLMLDEENDIAFYPCNDPSRAMDVANQTHPTVILVSLDSSEKEVAELLRGLRSNPVTRDTPLVALAENDDKRTKLAAFSAGANDFLQKLPSRLELVARIRYHSNAYIRLLQRNDAYAAVEQSRRQLEEEMQTATKYLRLLLPQPMNDKIAIDWRYIPWSKLGGDTFGYDWLDDEHLVLFVIDVEHHGLASAILSISIMNVLRSWSLPETDFHDPSQVLRVLNDTFSDSKYGGKHFSIWYGVFRLSDNVLRWSGGGHPAQLLFELERKHPKRLESGGPLMGASQDVDFESYQHEIVAGSRLYLFTDGVYEIHKPDQTIWTHDEFVEFMVCTPDSPGATIETVLNHVRRLRGIDQLDDDFSMIEVRFP